MIRKGLRPSVCLRRPRGGVDFPYAEVFPFRRSWVAIGVLLVFDIVFLIPAFTTFQEARELWQRPEGLFDLTAALFITFWLVGWSMGPLAMTAILAVLLFGREEIRARQGELEVYLGLPFAGARISYRAAGIRNLRLEQPAAKSGKSWRGSHAVFDYGANQGAFGSDLTPGGLKQIRERIETVTGVTLRTGEALPEDLTQDWEAQPQPVAPADPRSLSGEETVGLGSASTIALIAANIIPLIGAAFWGWDLGMVMLLYWAESAVIGFFNLCKIVVVGKWAALFIGPFFVGHFGGFMAGHFVFLYTLFLQGPQTDSSADASLADVAALFAGLWPALLVLFISHGFSFLRNFIGRQEYVGRSVHQQMGEPYSRIIFMHLVIIFGGGLAMIVGETTPVLMSVIVLKIAVDLRGHLKQRQRK